MADWFVHVDGSTSGPHPTEHVRHWVINRQLPPSVMFWPDGATSWLALAQAWPLLDSTPPQASPQHDSVARATPAQPASAQAPQGPPVQGLSAPVTDMAPYAAPYAAPDAGGTTVQQPSRNAVLGFTDRLADFAGVERITGFSLRELLSLATQRHSRDEIELNFATGLPGFTPPLDQVESDWPKPWMFVRLYASASLLFLGFVALVKIFQNPNLLPGMIMIGSFVVPLAVLVFFFETNTPRNVSLYVVARAFLTGGLISLAITLVLVEIGSSDNPWVGPLLTGVLEETGKLIAVFVIMLQMPGMRFPWILNGMLFGAAVGAGFAAFESAGYALRTLLASGRIDVDAAISLIFLRGALAPFGHVVWTALAAGALWRVKRDRHLTPAMLVDLRVLRVLGLVIALHAMWDYGVTLPFLLKYAALGVLAWFLILGMITSGLKQIKATQATAAGGGSSLPQPTALQPTVPPVGSG
ncbi:MAG: PrsW family glutamic-type intramembrane protease [Kineosporiaceae bacterium]